MNNPNFKHVEFDTFRIQAGLNSLNLTPKKWIEATDAIALISKSGRYRGTYAHKDLAFEFGLWISPMFKLLLIKEYQRLKEIESNQYNLEWNVKLPKELNKPVDGVYIFHGNSTRDSFELGGQGVWEVLKPGHGTGHSSTFEKNNLSDRFGVEITFALEMKKMFPGENIAIIKYSRGGTSIHIDAANPYGCWDPDFTAGSGNNQYDHFLATLNNAFSVKDIDRDGETDELIPAGILWMQGESDANTPEIANLYFANLKRLVDLMRAALLTDDLPVVIGRISDSGNDADGKVWDCGNIVRWQQARFVNQDVNAALITTTDNYGYSDKWHYDTVGYIDFGKQFAVEMQQLLK